MSDTPPAAAARGGPISLDELILLNEEIRALLRAGIPLEVGLRGSAGRIGGRLGQLTERLAARVEAGTPLLAALDAEGGRVPATYRAVLAAGLRSGRFDDVLAGVSQFATAMRDMRAHVARSLVYPAAVIGIGYVLFVGLMWYFVPWIDSTYEVFRIRDAWWLPPMRWLHQNVYVWGPAVPAIAVLLITGPWLIERLRRLSADESDDRPVQLGLVRWLPGVGGVVRNAQLARFAHLLAILAEHGVPFPEAARLSAGGTGDARLIRSVHESATIVEAGRPLDEALRAGTALPPFLRWQMVFGAHQSRMPAALRQAAEVYQQRATLRADWIQQVLPLLLVLVVGGGATVLYALTVFVPLSSLWRSLGT
jgi:general secretion pathway protein F